MDMKKIFALAVLLAFVITPLATTSFVSAQEQEFDYEAELRIPLGWWLDVLNPTASTTAYDWDVLGMIFDGFYAYHPWYWTNPEYDIPIILEERPTFEVVTTYVPGVGVMDVGRWTLKLKEGITFFDGQPLTADDVVFTYDFLLWLAPASEAWSDLPYFVINATKVDDYTVYVYAWDTGILFGYYALTGIVFPKHIYEVEDTWGITDDDEYDIFPVWNATADDVVSYTPQSPDDPILTGYGPFYIASWSGETFDTSDVIILERNPYYHNRAIDEKGNVVVPWSEMTPENPDVHGPYVKRLIFKVITEPAVEVQALLTNEIDMAAEFEFGAYVDLLAGFNLSYAPRRGFGHISVNCNNTAAAYGFLKDARFRRALAFAIDKRRVIDVAWYGYAEPLDIPVPKSMLDWSIEYTGEIPGPSYYDANPDAALELLEELNITNIDEDPYLEYAPEGPDAEIEIEIVATDVITVRRIVSTAAESIRALGIKVNERYVDFRELLDAIFGGTFQLTFFGFSLGRFPTFLYAFTSVSGANYWIWRWYSYTYYNVTYNITYDEAVFGMLLSSTLEDAKAWAWEAEKILYWEQPIIPIYQNIIIGVWNGTLWKGVVKDYVGAPVVNWYTIMKAAKIKVAAPAPPPPAIPAWAIWTIVGIIVIIIVAAIFLAMRKRPAE